MYKPNLSFVYYNYLLLLNIFLNIIEKKIGTCISILATYIHLYLRNLHYHILHIYDYQG